MRVWFAAALTVVLVAGCDDPPAPDPDPPRFSPLPTSVVELAAGTVIPIGFGADGFPVHESVPDDPPEEKSLRGPHYGATAVKTDEADEIYLTPRMYETVTKAEPAGAALPAPTPPAGPDDTVVLRPAAGADLISIHLAGSEVASFDGNEGSGLGAAAQSVKVGDAAPVPITKILSDGILIVSAPQKAPVTLIVDDEGHRQTLDVRTGRRLTSLPHTYGSRDSGVATTTFQIRADHRIGVTVSGTVLPWAADGGYAPKGKKWLVFEVSVGAMGDRVIAVDLDRTRLLAVRAGGRTLRPKAGRIKLTLTGEFPPTSPTPTTSLAVLVPENTRSVDVTLALAGTYRFDGSGPMRPIRVLASSELTSRIEIK